MTLSLVPCGDNTLHSPLVVGELEEGKVGGEHPSQVALPVQYLKPAWRAACNAYRRVRQSGQLDGPAWLAARAAIREFCADFDDKAAGEQASAAILYASVHHPSWLWRGCASAKD